MPYQARDPASGVLWCGFGELEEVKKDINTLHTYIVIVVK